MIPILWQPATFINKNTGHRVSFKGTRDQSTTFEKLGSSSTFPFRDHSKTFLGIREILEIFLGNTGIQAPQGAFNLACQGVIELLAK